MGLPLDMYWVPLVCRSSVIFWAPWLFLCENSLWNHVFMACLFLQVWLCFFIVKYSSGSWDGSKSPDHRIGELISSCPDMIRTMLIRSMPNKWVSENYGWFFFFLFLLIVKIISSIYRSVFLWTLDKPLLGGLTPGLAHS